MNLTKMMAAAGIGCGENCVCATAFANSLDDIQRALFGHMIEKGAKKRLEAIAGGMGEHQDPTLASFMNQLFENPFDGAHHEPLNPADVLKRAMMRANGIDPEAAPYEGELRDDLTSVLAQVPEDERERAEHFLRQIIATKADGDPARVEVEITDMGLEVMIRGNEATADEDNAASAVVEEATA